MDPVALLDLARQAGLTVRAEGGTLVVQGPKRAAAIQAGRDAADAGATSMKARTGPREAA